MSAMRDDAIDRVRRIVNAWRARWLLWRYRRTLRRGR